MSMAENNPSQPAPSSSRIAKAVQGIKKKVKSSTYVLRLDKYPAYFIIGRRGGGKSVLLERMLEFYWHHGYVILDWNSAFDLESLQWCVEDPDRKAQSKPTRAYPILIIIPRWKRVEITNPRKIMIEKDGEKIEVDAVKTVYDDTPLHKIIMMAHEERRVCIFSIYLYSPNISAGQRKIAQFLSAGGLPEAIRDHLPANIKCALGLRELKDLSSSSMHTHGGGGERESKRSLNFISAQARHARIVLICDMQNPDDVNKAMVRQEDYLLIKNFSKHHIPEWLRWLQDEVKSKLHWARRHYKRLNLVSINRLSKNSFYCIHPDGHYSLEHNKQPLFRHHQEEDDAQELAGIKIEKVAESELKQNPAVKLEKAKQEAEKNKELTDTLQECLVMKEKEGMGWKEIQAIKKVKDDKGKVMDFGALGRKVNRYWKEYKLIKLPEDSNPGNDVESSMPNS